MAGADEVIAELRRVVALVDEEGASARTVAERLDGVGEVVEGDGGVVAQVALEVAGDVVVPYAAVEAALGPGARQPVLSLSEPRQRLFRVAGRDPSVEIMVFARLAWHESGDRVVAFTVRRDPRL